MDHQQRIIDHVLKPLKDFYGEPNYGTGSKVETVKTYTAELKKYSTASLQVVIGKIKRQKVFKKQEWHIELFPKICEELETSGYPYVSKTAMQQSTFTEAKNNFITWAQKRIDHWDHPTEHYYTHKLKLPILQDLMRQTQIEHEAELKKLNAKTYVEIGAFMFKKSILPTQFEECFKAESNSKWHQERLGKCKS